MTVSPRKKAQQKKQKEAAPEQIQEQKTIQPPPMEKQQEVPQSPVRIAGGNFVPVIGVIAVAKFLGYSTRTVHRWRFEFRDFPVTSDGFSCEWRSTEAELSAWREKHIDLFISHKQRQNERIDAERRRQRRW